MKITYLEPIPCFGDKIEDGCWMQEKSMEINPHFTTVYSAPNAVLKFLGRPQAGAMKMEPVIGASCLLSTVTVGREKSEILIHFAHACDVNKHILAARFANAQKVMQTGTSGKVEEQPVDLCELQRASIALCKGHVGQNQANALSIARKAHERVAKFWTNGKLTNEDFPLSSTQSLTVVRKPAFLPRSHTQGNEVPKKGKGAKTAKRPPVSIRQMLNLVSEDL